MIDWLKDVPLYVDIATYNMDKPEEGFILQLQGKQPSVGSHAYLGLVAIGDSLQSDRAVLELFVKDGRPHAALRPLRSN